MVIFLSPKKWTYIWNSASHVGKFSPNLLYRTCQILRSAADGCRSRPWLASWPTTVSAYWRCSQTLTVISVQFLSPIWCNVSSVRTWRRRLTSLFFTEPVSLNLLACLQIGLWLCTGRPGNFTPNLRRASEHVWSGECWVCSETLPLGKTLTDWLMPGL